MFTIRELKNKLITLRRFFKNGDYSAIAMVFSSAGFCLLGLLFSVPTVLILWILKPFFWLKVGKLYHERIGHLTLNTDLFLRRRQLGIYPDGPYYCFLVNPEFIANHQLLTMYKRVIPICESRVLVLAFRGMLPILKRTPFYQEMPMNSNEYYEFNNAKPSLYFTPDEIKKGRKTLNQMNVDFDKDKFVCIFSRDEAYLNNIIPHTDWSYQNSRNADIDNLIETAKYLIEKGFVVIRMGSVVTKPINFFHKKMIDYPYSEHRNDFMDIFIHAHCKFLVSAGTSGINSAAAIFDKPILWVGIAEYNDAPFGKNCLYTPKKYKYSSTHDYLHFKDGIKLGAFWHNPAAFGLEAEEVNSQDTLEATQEMLARVEGRFRYSPESERLIQAYQKLRDEAGGSRVQCKGPIGIAWLKKNRTLYF